MAHFGTKRAITSTTDTDWLGTSAQVSELVNNWAGRSDLVAFVGERASVDMGAPALYNPASAEIEVNTGVAFGTCDAQYVGDLRQRDVQYDFPKAVGAIYHEACHAKFTTWDLVKSAKELTESQNRALHLLEESRIERLGVLTNPRNKLFLRTSAMEIVMSDLKDEDIAKLSSTRQAGQVVGLTYARVDAGVLDPADIDPLRVKVEELLGDILPELTAIWQEFQILVPDYDEARMYELAIEWDKLIQDKAEENGEGGESAEGEGGVAVSFSDELAEAGEAIEVEVYSALGDQQTREDYEEIAKKKNDTAKEQKDNKQKAEDVFSKGTGPDESSATNSRLTETRKPTSEERVSAVKIGRALDKAKYRDRDRTNHASELPPGRLRTRVLVQGEALKSKGVVARTEPFQRIQRKHTDDPTLTVGVMVDISGSMGDAMNPMASTAWILSEATKRVQGRVAMVYYGSAVFPTLKPGQHLENVNVYSAPDGTEKFDDAFRALDGSLNLLAGSGARLLVIVSDGQYTVNEQDHARRWIQRCQQSGVAVLWVGAGYYGAEQAQKYLVGTDAQFVRLGASATEVADEIGRLAGEALTRIGSRR